MNPTKTKVTQGLQAVILTDIIIGAEKDSIIYSACHEGVLHIGPKGKKKISVTRNHSILAYLYPEKEITTKANTTFIFQEGAIITIHYSRSTLPKIEYEETEYIKLRR